MAELQKRRPLRMQGYDYSEQGLYFLTVCVKDKEKILCDIVGGGVLDAPRPELTAVGKIVDKYIKSINNTQNVTIEKYVIMPDHIHLLVFVENEGYYGTSRTPSPTNNIIPKTISGFKRLCNKEIGKNIWQRGYYDHVIRNEADYGKHFDYIENNPVLWLENRHVI